MKKILYIYDYFIYRLKAVNEHGVHSPFVFDLLTNVIYNKHEYYCYKKIEKIRLQLLNSKKTIKISNSDGNTNLNETDRLEKKVSQITKQYLKAPKYSQLLFRLVNYFSPSQIIELGTSIGINTAYMASANSKNKIITFEKNKEIAEIAKQNFKQLGLKPIEMQAGNTDIELKMVLSNFQNKNLFVCFDGNHCKQNTLNYFYLCLEKADEASIFVFQDMYLSEEKREAWNEIKNNTKVRVTIDLFFMGIIFFRTEQKKQHFIIKF